MRRIIVLCVLMWWSSFAVAGLEEGKAAYKKHNYTSALKEFRLLANKGNAEAQALLASMYETGSGVKVDDVLAMKWYRQAAELGNANALTSMGMYYEHGRGGVSQDYAQAAEWYRKAAEQGSPYAQMFLGRLYEQGKGVPQDYVLAYQWMALSAANPDPSVADAVMIDRDALSAKMTKAQIEEAQRLAREWANSHSKAKP